MPLNVSVFTVDELRAATDDFDDSRLIGAGGCSLVFRGTLASGEVVAVKRWVAGTDAQLSLTELMNELYTLGSIAHPNLLPVLGFVCQPPELMLVTLHMARGSLHDALHGGSAAAAGLDAAWRLSFLSGLARGIQALHAKNFVHRDVKGANVLIGDDGRAVLADAGVARRLIADADAAAAAAGAGAGANANAVDGDDSGAGLEAGGAPQSTTDGGGDTAAAVCGDSGIEVKEGNREGDAGKDTDRDASKEAEKEAEKDNRTEASGTRAALHAPKFIRSRRGAAGAAVASTRISLGSKEGAELPLQRSSCDEVPKRGGGGGEKGVSASGPHRTVSAPPRTSRDSCGGGNVKDAAASKDEAGEEEKKEEKCASASETDTPSPLVPAAVSPSAEAAPDSPSAAVKFAPLFLVKLGDFGLSVQLKPGSKASTYGGTPHYISPEIVEGRPYEFPTDVWALGCCLYEMLMGKRPFDSGSKDRQKLRLAIAQGQYERVPTERCGGQLRRLVEKCLSYMPEDRPSVSEILEVSCVRNTVRDFRERLAEAAAVGGIAENVAKMGIGEACGGDEEETGASLVGNLRRRSSSGIGLRLIKTDDGADGF
uniref:Protein kinase domain-containing protein n=1 Tax=Mantoniella antarctica TaxID=81844 RepID=A0A7S0SVZ2_9CHLO|mmetsp:Transcript_34886/g.87405  ORF Transcript_34886/g.87405 Transcript_34886/m.87405 type:complete len:597 (+) Transcript_34886:339-2129(+)